MQIWRRLRDWEKLGTDLMWVAWLVTFKRTILLFVLFSTPNSVYSVVLQLYKLWWRIIEAMLVKMGPQRVSIVRSFVVLFWLAYQARSDELGFLSIIWTLLTKASIDQSVSCKWTEAVRQRENSFSSQLWTPRRNEKFATAYRWYL